MSCRGTVDETVYFVGNNDDYPLCVTFEDGAVKRYQEGHLERNLQPVSDDTYTLIIEEKNGIIICAGLRKIEN